MAYYGGGANALRQALMLGGRPGIVPPIQMPQQRPQQAPARMRQPAVSYPSRPAAPPQVAQGRMTPQQLGALGRGGTAQYRYPNEGIQREPNQPNRYMTGTQKFMSQMLGAQPKTGADLDRLDAAKRMGFLTAGLSLLGNIGGVQRPDLPGHPGSFGRNLADALSTGIGMSRGTFAASEPVAPEFISGPGGGIYRYDSEGGALTQAVPGVGEQYTLAPGARRFGPGGELLAEGGPEPTEPTDLEKEQEKFRWFESLTPEQQEAYNYMRRNPPSQTNIHTGDTVTPRNASEEAMSEWLQELYGMRQTIEGQTLPGLQNIEETLAIVDHARFDEISGVLRGNAAADVVARVRGDPVLLGMIGAFERLGQERTLQILANFTGAKSNYELDAARKMAQGDRSLSPEEMRAGLNLMRRAYVQDAVRWARDIQGLAPIEGEFSDIDAGVRNRAQSSLDQYGEEESTFYQAVDPAGIGRGRTE